MWLDIVTVACLALNIVACIVDILIYGEIVAACFAFALYKRARRAILKKGE